LLHDLLGQHWADYGLTAVYESFSTWVPLSVIVALAFADRIRDAFVFVASAAWVWVLGIVSYYLVPSIGPFASSPHHFSGLPQTVVTSRQAQFVGQRLYLLRHPHDNDAFSQLAAFGSLHVGFTCMTLLVLRHFGFRWPHRAMTVYLGAVMLATVYLGWHFAVDDVAGVALAFAAVALGRWTVGPSSDSA
jgi:membrane-associated phospholipid phosphatase